MKRLLIGTALYILVGMSFSLYSAKNKKYKKNDSGITEREKLQKKLTDLDHEIELIDHKLKLLRDEKLYLNVHPEHINTVCNVDENATELDRINQEIDRLHAQRFNNYENKLQTTIDTKTE